MNGEELTPWLLRYGYERGAFPMTVESGEVCWFQPRYRALFPITGIHVSRSLQKTIRQEKFEVRFDTDFIGVMQGCFRPGDNWLSEHFVRAYTQCFYEGWAHCAECWQDGTLVGGVYGLALGSCFSAESMFHRRTDASKVALAALIDKCRDSGFTIFDAQIMNSHLASLGAYEIPNSEYLDLLEGALSQPTTWTV